MADCRYYYGHNEEELRQIEADLRGQRMEPRYVQLWEFCRDINVATAVVYAFRDRTYYWVPSWAVGLYHDRNIDSLTFVEQFYIVATNPKLQAYYETLRYLNCDQRAAIWTMR